MNRFHPATGFVAVAAAAIAAVYWTTSDPAHSRAALAADATTVEMGAAPGHVDSLAGHRSDSFEKEKLAAPIHALPAQF